MKESHNRSTRSRAASTPATQPALTPSLLALQPWLSSSEIHYRIGAVHNELTIQRRLSCRFIPSQEIFDPPEAGALSKSFIETPQLEVDTHNPKLSGSQVLDLDNANLSDSESPGEVSMIVELADLEQLEQSDQGDGPTSSLDLVADLDPNRSELYTGDVGASATVADVDVTQLDSDMQGGPTSELGSLSSNGEMVTSLISDPADQSLSDDGLQNFGVPEGLPPLAPINEMRKSSEISELPDVGTSVEDVPEDVSDISDAQDAQEIPGIPEIPEIPDIPKPRGPQLYGDLFDDEHADEGEEQKGEAIPEPETAQGTGNFRIVMNQQEQKDSLTASSVELAAALGLDEGEEEPKIEDQPTALVDSAVQSPAATNATSSSQLQTIDWRSVVESKEVPPSLTRKLLNQAFANEVEKHVALQSVAVMSGSCAELNNWHWRVWRKPNEFGYKVRGKERFPESEQREILQSSLAKLVLATSPVFVRAYRRRFTVEYLSRKLKVPAESIIQNRQPFGWRDQPTGNCGFIHYADRIKKRGYKLFDLPGLEQKVFYEIQHRTIYIDRRYYSTVPPSHLFHRILNVLWSVQMQYFVPLALNPKKDAFPIVAEIADHFSSKGMTAIKSRLKGRSDTIKALEGLDQKKLRDLYERVGMPKVEALNQLWFAMQSQVYLIVLAETLDLVGSLESIVNRDFLEPDALQPGEIIRLNPYAQVLIHFMTKVNI